MVYPSNKGWAVFELPFQPKAIYDNSAPTAYALVGRNMHKNPAQGGNLALDLNI